MASSKIVKYSEKIIEGSLLLLVLGLPLIFEPFGFEKYDLAKVTFLRVISLIILTAWLINILEAQEFVWVKSPLDLPLLIFGLVLFLSTLTSVHPATSIYGEFSRYEGTITFLNYFFLYYACLNHLKEKRQFQNLLTAFLVSSSLVALYGIFQHFGYDFFGWLPETQDPGRISATFGNAVFLGAFLVFILPLAFSQFLEALSLKRTLLLGVAITLILCALLFSFTRAAWIGAFGGVFFILFFRIEKIFKDKKLLLSLSLVVLFVTIIYKFPTPQREETPPYYLGRRVASTLQLREGSIAGRLSIWKSAVQAIEERPFLGSGLDTFGLVFPKYRASDWAKIERKDAIADKAHNDLLQVAATTGLLGLLAYLVIIFTFFRKSFTFLKKSLFNSSYFPLFLGFLGGGIGYILQIQFSFSVVSVSPMFWLIIGATFALGRKTETFPKVSFKFGKKPLSLGAKGVIYFVLTALVVFLSVLTIKPLLADYHFNQGLRSQASPWIDETIAHFEKATQLRPQEDVYYSFLAQSYVQKSRLSHAGDIFWLRKGIETHLKALEINPWSEADYLELGVIYAENEALLQKIEEETEDKAVSYFKKVIALDPNNVDAHFNLGLIYQDKNKFNQAISQFKKVVRLDPNDRGARETLERLEKEK